ncbi:RNA polymerase sigma factor [Flavobacterium aciduliphilum]|uniref:RNA polymerase sigma-70 factor (ECF subfamily) n=1 Tax=Flavobacterium aciduliphilum TaxID=1101402 RepID=A0A328YY55_9FLAO|nr:sigma-70 family RNA polymerase sigma factor [Flavobacterium aciduliphilum]RAR75467.1 RNA polymerase sigma-70 factor (ECF subfamily) [Flavobacterium aciduliphilum]
MQRDAQRQVYEYMSPKLYHTCKRYLKKEEEIEEVLADSFYTIFTKMDQLKELYAFEAWSRKITVNNCLRCIKNQVNFNLYLEDTHYKIQPESVPDTQLEEEDLLKLLDLLPQGCKTVFNLFAIEGYGHKEIAVMLHISEGTSKSQLNVAKSKLKELVNTHFYKKTN